MKVIKFVDLKNDIYFWRKASERRWLKYGDKFAIMVDGHDIETIDEEELILSDPNWCSECWEQLSKWPIPMICPNCSVCQYRELQELYQSIETWTGFKCHHI